MRLHTAESANVYSKVFYTDGGRYVLDATLASGTGTQTLKRAPLHGNESPPTTAASYTAYATETTITATGKVGIFLEPGYYTSQLSSGSSPAWTVEVNPVEERGRSYLTNTTPS